MTCLHCGGLLERGHTPFHLDRKGIHLQFDAVPAWVCRQCGEPLYEEATVESMQGILAAADEAEAKMQLV